MRSAMNPQQGRKIWMKGVNLCLIITSSQGHGLQLVTSGATSSWRNHGDVSARAAWRHWKRLSWVMRLAVNRGTIMWTTLTGLAAPWIIQSERERWLDQCIKDWNLLPLQVPGALTLIVLTRIARRIASIYILVLYPRHFLRSFLNEVWEW
jgi:hypothetical protein